MSQTESPSDSKPKTPWSKLGTIISMVALIGMLLFFFIPRYIDKKYSQLEFLQFYKAPLLSFNEDIEGLKIILNEGDISVSNQNISLFYVRIRNTGNIPVLKEYFDSAINYGLMVQEGKIISNPELVRASDSLYYTNVFGNIEDFRIEFQQYIFNPDDYFDIKFFVLHERGVNPILKSFGKVANQPEIILLTSLVENKGSVSRDDVIGIVIITIIVSIFFYRIVDLYISSRLQKKASRSISEESVEFLSNEIYERLKTLSNIREAAKKDPDDYPPKQRE